MKGPHPLHAQAPLFNEEANVLSDFRRYAAFALSAPPP